MRVTYLDIATPPWFKGRPGPGRMKLLSSIPRGSSPDLADQMRQFGDDQLLQRQPAGIGRARQREKDATLNDPALRPREHGRRADLLVGEHAEELAKTAQPLVEERLDRLEGRVAAGDARASREDESLYRRRGTARADHSGHLRGVVLDDGVSRDAMAGRGQELADERAARIGLGRLAIRHGQHEAAN